MQEMMMCVMAQRMLIVCQTRGRDRDRERMCVCCMVEQDSGERQKVNAMMMMCV
jgi:hypothetical protein